MQFQPDGMSPEDLKRLLEAVPQLAIAPSGLVGVIAVAQVAEAAGVTIELLAIEVREAGALVTWRARADRAVGIMIPQVSISDDQGTAYRAFGGSGGGDEHTWSGEIALLPFPPAGVTLDIVIERLGGDEHMRMPGWTPNAPIPGPWRFTVPTHGIKRR